MKADKSNKLTSRWKLERTKSPIHKPLKLEDLLLTWSTSETGTPRADKMNQNIFLRKPIVVATVSVPEQCTTSHKEQNELDLYLSNLKAKFIAYRTEPQLCK